MVKDPRLSDKVEWKNNDVYYLHYETFISVGS